MLKGRNLHWNVYYDMLALSTNEKKKLKAICKFPSTFGIVWPDFFLLATPINLFKYLIISYNGVQTSGNYSTCPSTS